MRTTYRETATVYLPAGTKARIKAAAAEHGLSASSFIRVVILERLKLTEAGHQLDVKAGDGSTPPSKSRS